ncbi:hypothetical protein MMC25_000249 [Agyrium rufum]|nr:hypothetical protein [Agyrium rufum]
MFSRSSLSAAILASAALLSPSSVAAYNLGILPGTYDYVVIGGGTGGLTIATRLAENYKVAVIEAGTFYETTVPVTSTTPALATVGAGQNPTDVNPGDDWGFFTTPQYGLHGQSAHYARGKCLGGTSARNYFVYQRGTCQSYDAWATLVNDQSYTFANLLPYFEKSLTFTPPPLTRSFNSTPLYDPTTLGNQSGPLSVTFGHYAQPFSSWAELGLAEVGVLPRFGFTSGGLIGSAWNVQTFSTNSMRESSETSFLEKEGSKQAGLTVYEFTTALKVVFSGTTATGVQVSLNDTSTFTINAAKEVILSAGTFQSPQLLMVSGVGPSATLQKLGIPVISNLAGVGQNMWDHVFGGPSYRVNVQTTSSFSNPAYLANAEAQYASNGTGPLSQFAADFLAWNKIPSNLRANFSSSTSQKLALFPSDWPEVEFLITSAYVGDDEGDMPADTYNYASILMALVAPLSRGNITISSASALDPPVINPGWLTDPADQQVAVAAYRYAREVFATKIMKPVLIGPEYYPGSQYQTDAQILSIVKQSFFTVWHASCTCKMGVASDKMAVVDSHARVFGVKNLRVVDASAFPILPPGHPQSTIYALAEKIADLIKAGQ